MYDFEILAGDFGKGTGLLYPNNKFYLPKQGDIKTCLLSGVEVATEERIKKIGGTVGWGIVGGALLGPVGLLAGLVAGGKEKKIVFVVQFRDGRKMLCSSDQKAFTAIQAAAFDAPAAYEASLSAKPKAKKTDSSGCLGFLLFVGLIAFLLTVLHC
jgi:hypothetical protein